MGRIEKKNRIEIEYVRYEGESQFKNTEIGDRGRYRDPKITWGAPRTLEERKEWGKVSGKRRIGEPIKSRTYSDQRRRKYEQRRELKSEVEDLENPRRERERRREHVSDMEDKREVQEAGKLYTKSVWVKKSQVQMTKSESKRQEGEGRPYELQILKVTRAIRQKKWGRGENQRRDGRGLLTSGERCRRTEVSQAGGVCVEKRTEENSGIE